MWSRFLSGGSIIVVWQWRKSFHGKTNNLIETELRLLIFKSIHFSGQYSMHDVCNQELGTFYRLGRQTSCGKRIRIQHDSLHAVAGILNGLFSYYQLFFISNSLKRFEEGLILHTRQPINKSWILNINANGTFLLQCTVFFSLDKCPNCF